jgi:hypothetical protein
MLPIFNCVQDDTKYEEQTNKLDKIVIAQYSDR